MEKMPWDGPKWGREGLSPANPDILGDMDLDLDRISFLILFWIPNFWMSRFPDFQNLVRAGLGPGRARLEPSGPKNVDFPLMFELATPCFV